MTTYTVRDFVKPALDSFRGDVDIFTSYGTSSTSFNLFIVVLLMHSFVFNIETGNTICCN